MLTLEKVPRYNPDHTLAEWEVLPEALKASDMISAQRKQEIRNLLSLTIWNTFIAIKPVTIRWIDEHEDDRADVKIQLVKQNVSGDEPVNFGEEVVLDKSNQYTYTWKNLLSYPTDTSKTTYRPI